MPLKNKDTGTLEIPVKQLNFFPKPITYELKFLKNLDFTSTRMVHAFMDQLEIPYREMTVTELRSTLALYAQAFQCEPGNSYVIEQLRDYVDGVAKWLNGGDYIYCLK